MADYLHFVAHRNLRLALDEALAEYQLRNDEPAALFLVHPTWMPNLYLRVHAGIEVRVSNTVLPSQIYVSSEVSHATPHQATP